jgi:hypothetical protein
MGPQYHVDGVPSAFIERQLEAVKAKSFDVKYANLQARQFIPVSHETPSGAETVKINSYDMFGTAKIIGAYANDLPRADVKVAELRQAIRSLGVSFGYNVQELRSAQMTGLPLEQRKANAARRANEQAVDSIAANGDSVNGLSGLLTLSNTLTYTIPNGASGHADWARKTGQEMLADLVNATSKIVSTSKDVEHPTTWLLPINQYNLIANTNLNTGIAATVLSHFLATNPYIKEVFPWYRLTNAGSGGSVARAVCYVRDPDHLWLEIPQEFEMFPAQQEGLEFEIPCHSRIGGVLCPYPASVLYMDSL